MKQNAVYITYAKRTPIGSFGSKGDLCSYRPDDLLSLVFLDFKKNCTFPLETIDDTIVGCANQAGEDNRNIARMSLILADFPFSVPGTTINRLCGSSLDAILDGYCRIRSGMNECILVGGVESMSRAPYVLSKANMGFDRDQKLYDTALGWRFENQKMANKFPLLSMGQTAQKVADELHISREDQDVFAYQSHQKAIKSLDTKAFEKEILPISMEQNKATKVVTVITNDQGIRRDCTLEKLGSLKGAFKENGSVTAGNSSTLNDGASCVFLASENFCKTHGLEPLVEILGGATSGIHPNIMGLGPIEAIKKLEKNYHIQRNQFEFIELNEAFAAQALGCIRGLDLNPDLINTKGGAIALGHALGNSGTRIVTTLIHRMIENKNYLKNPRLGLASMCIGVGQGIALAVSSV